MKKHNRYAVLGLKALKRAAEKVAIDAQKDNLKIPIWNKGRIEFKVPDLNIKQNASEEARSSRA